MGHPSRRGARARLRRRRRPAGAARFDAIVREYLARHARPRKRTWREDERILARDVLPLWGTWRARDITARDVRRLLDAIVDRDAPIQANRTFAVVRRIFNWAAAPDRGLVPQGHNPCRGLERPAPERQRERVLGTDELGLLWHALASEPCDLAALFKLYLLTAQRDGEVRAMAWAEVDLSGGWWTIPAERAKNSRAHRVPLSPPAVELLRGLHARRDPAVRWVFPTVGASASGHRERVYKAVHRLRRRSGVADFTPHDLRRTAASHMTSIGVPRSTVAKLLNHTDRGVTAVYDRYGYDREKREALIAWAARLEEIVGSGSGRVIGFRA
jgi:integrase